MFKKILFTTLILYTLVGFVAVPFILKPQLVQLVQNQLNANISIESIYFNPYIFKLKLSGIELKSLQKEHLFSLDSIAINLEPHSLFNKTLHLKELLLQNPKLSLVIAKDKTLNLLSILKDPKKQEKSEEEKSSLNLRVKLDSVIIDDGTIFFEDNTKKSKFDFTFNQIGFELKDIDTADFNSSDATLRFYTQLEDGGFLDIQSNIKGFSPFIVDGNLHFKASKLYTQWRYIKDMLNLEIADGKLSLDAKYHFNLEDLNATALYDTSIHLKRLRVKPKNRYKDVLNLATLDIDGITIKPMLQEVVVSDITLKSLAIKALRESNGKIDWNKYLQVSSTNHSTSDDTNTTKENQKKPWKVLVKNISLEKMSTIFKDKAIKPNVETQLNELNFNAQNVTLLGEEPFSYHLDTLINSSFKCQSDGDITHKSVTINSQIQCSNFNIAHYRAYIDDIAKSQLKKYNLRLTQATTSFDAKVHIEKTKDDFAFNLLDSNLNLHNLAVIKRDDNSKVVKFSDFSLSHATLDSLKKSIYIEDIKLDNLNIDTQRYKDATLNLEKLIVAKKSSKKDKKAEERSKEYTLKLKHFALNNAKVTFLDSYLSPSIKSSLDKIEIDAYNIDSKKRSWLNYNLKARVNKRGFITSKGKLSHTPLKQKGEIQLKNIYLVDLNPYLKESLYTTIKDGNFNLKAKISYAPSKNRPDFKMHGSMNIKELFIDDSRDNTSLLSFSKFGFKSFELETSPNRFHSDLAYLNSFYVNALIDEQKNLNFALLTKKSSAKETQKTQKKKKSNFPFKITKLSINNGSAEFADDSIPLKFHTHIHNLDGDIYSLSSRSSDTSYIDIKGEVDKYGATKLKGSINSSNPKKYTNLDFSFTNLELSALSGYSASFAGYKLKSGKLFLDLGYDIVDSKIKGSNNIMIKKIELGDKIEDENTTSIPLGFIVALLEDSDGIIDIDMPVEGNVDAPDFKYGSFVFKTFGNLLLKAVLSPFSFLGSMMGMDGDELASLEFEVGKTNILPPQREKLDKVAKMMLKRPKISLSIGGRYDPIADRKELQVQKLITLVLEKSGIKNRDEHKSAMTIEVLEDIYEELRDDGKLQKIKETLEKKYIDNEKEFQKVYLQRAIDKTVALQVVSKDELQNLAKQRANIIKNYLVTSKNISSSRVVIKNIQGTNDTEDKKVKIDMEIVVK